MTEPKKKFETGWIDDVFSDFLKDSTYHLEENLPALSEILAQECYEIIEKPLISEFVKDWSFYMCLKFSNIKSRVRKMAIFENWMYKKWEARSK